MSFKNLLILPLLVVTTTLFAQQQNEVYLLDLESSMPIVGATFQYGDQNGVSDNDGILSFYFSETDTMFLSHVSYGTWKWTPEEVNEVILNKVYYRSKTTLSMYPVTVVAVRNQNQQPDERLNIDLASEGDRSTKGGSSRLRLENAEGAEGASNLRRRRVVRNNRQSNSADN